LLKDVFAYLKARAVLGAELYVLSPEFVPVSVGVNVRVLDPATEQQTLKAVEQALLLALWTLPPGGPRQEGWPLGRAVDLNELKAQVARVPGILSVTDLRLFHREPAGLTWLELIGSPTLHLVDYQLPELMAVEATVGDGPAKVPSGFGPETAGGAGSDEPALDDLGGEPVPVIPEIC
jgi:hypothetical protein